MATKCISVKDLDPNNSLIFTANIIEVNEQRDIVQRSLVLPSLWDTPLPHIMPESTNV